MLLQTQRMTATRDRSCEMFLSWKMHCMEGGTRHLRAMHSMQEIGGRRGMQSAFREKPCEECYETQQTSGRILGFVGAEITCFAVSASASPTISIATLPVKQSGSREGCSHRGQHIHNEVHHLQQLPPVLPSSEQLPRRTQISGMHHRRKHKGTPTPAALHRLHNELLL